MRQQRHPDDAIDGTSFLAEVTSPDFFRVSLCLTFTWGPLNTNFAGCQVNNIFNMWERNWALNESWSRIGQMARRPTPERSRARVQSDSSQRCRSRRGRSQDRRERRALREHPEVTWCADGMILETHKESLKYLEPMQVHCG